MPRHQHHRPEIARVRHSRRGEGLLEEEEAAELKARLDDARGETAADRKRIETLEEEINTIEGLKTLTSTARDAVGTITAEFELWRDIDVAAQDVRDRVDRARNDLPEDIEEPIVRKQDPDAQAIMWIALTADERWSMVDLTEYADKNIKERLQNVRGVGQIQVITDSGMLKLFYYIKSIEQKII